jgi:hypothetical protein
MKFIDLLSEYQIDYTQTHHHVTEGWIGVDCPFCSRNARKYRLGYNIATGRLYCWVCGSVNIFKVLQELTNESGSALQQLIGSLDRVSASRDYHRPVGKLKLPNGLQELGKSHRDYLTRRGFDPDEIVELWGVKAIGLAAKLSWRLWIPIYYKQQMASWTTRSIAFKATAIGTPRYISAKASESSVSLRNLLYGADFVRHAVAVCEGPLSAWAIGYGAIATLGVGYSQEQLHLISQYPNRYIVFDAEPQAQKRARKLCDDLSVFPGKTVNLVLETGKDTNEASKQEVQEIRRMLA